MRLWHCEIQHRFQLVLAGLQVEEEYRTSCQEDLEAMTPTCKEDLCMAKPSMLTLLITPTRIHGHFYALCSFTCNQIQSVVKRSR